MRGIFAMSGREYTCCDCGATRSSSGKRGRLRKRCDDCKKKAMRKRQAWICPVTCEFCGLAVLGSKDRKWCEDCSDVFRAAEKFTCKNCGVKFKKTGGRSKNLFCSVACYSAGRRAANRKTGLELLLECVQNELARERFARARVLKKLERFCGDVIAKERKTSCRVCGSPGLFGRGAKVCSDRCRKTAKRRRKPKGSRNHTVRAKKRGLRRVYSITLAKVAHRDRHVCQLCGCPTLMFHVEGDPRSPSVDHIVPLGNPRNLSHGHTWENVQLACRSCNERKNNRLEHEDLLFCANPRETVARLRQQHGLMYECRGA